MQMPSQIRVRNFLLIVSDVRHLKYCLQSRAIRGRSGARGTHDWLALGGPPRVLDVRGMA